MNKLFNCIAVDISTLGLIMLELGAWQETTVDDWEKVFFVILVNRHLFTCRTVI